MRFVGILALAGVAGAILYMVLVKLIGAPDWVAFMSCAALGLVVGYLTDV